MRAGFTIIEALVYMAVSALLCMLTVQWSALSQHAMRQAQMRTRSLMMVHAALDHCARDVRAASSIVAISPHAYELMCGEQSVSWARDPRGRLVRSDGGSKIFIADTVKDFSLTELDGVWQCALCDEQGNQATRAVVFRARRIV